MNAKLKKYLQKNHIEPAPGANHRPIQIVIPALAESESLRIPLESLIAQGRGQDQTAITVVVNNEEGDRTWRFEDNQKTLEILGSNSALRKAVESAGYRFKLIDRASPGKGLPPKTAGVGTARKAGLDHGLGELVGLDGRGLLVSLDADCAVPGNYLDALLTWELNRREYGAGVVDYAHPLPDDPTHRRAIALYEIRLRYTEALLRKIGTPYAFATIGSTIICRPDAYVLAGGMNTRKATEDFYFLMHLAKAAPVDRIRETVVAPSARVSDRVYLGTGHGVGKLIGSDEPYLLEPPIAYEIVGRALRILIEGFGKDAEETLRELKKHCRDLIPFLESKKLSATHREALAGTKTFKSYERRIHQWFDALKIRQAVHFLCENSRPMIPWNEAVDELTDEAVDGDKTACLLKLRHDLK